jgi:hypothetical protein
MRYHALSVIAGCCVLLIVLLAGGCASPNTPHSPARPGLSASAEATQALSGVWEPVLSDVSPELVSVSIGGDGSAVTSMKSASSVVRFSGKVGGEWHSPKAGLVIFQQGSPGSIGYGNAVPKQLAGASATYKFSTTGSTLTLTWVGGSPPGGVSAGPIHYQMAEGNSWITGSRGSFQLTRQR